MGLYVLMHALTYTELRPNKSVSRHFVPWGKFTKLIQAKVVAVNSIALKAPIYVCTWVKGMNIDATDPKGFIVIKTLSFAELKHCW